VTAVPAASGVRPILHPLGHHDLDMNDASGQARLAGKGAALTLGALPPAKEWLANRFLDRLAHALATS